MKRAGRIAVLFLVACGLLPQDDLTGRRVGDGIAPWQDLGAVELCLGALRVGPPASQIGGFCSPDAAGAPAACAEDEDCGSRERCICGRCSVPFCSSAGECGLGLVCNFSQNRCDAPCTGEEDCGARESCLSGVCRGACDGDEDCQTGEVCAMQGTRRVCIADPCTDDAECQGDEHCETQREPRAVAGPTVLAAPDGDPEAPPFAMWVEMSHRTLDDRAIWRAISNDGVSWRFAPADPVLEDGGDAHQPTVAFQDGAYRLLYERTGGLAESTSADGVSFGAPSGYLSGDVHAPAATVGPDGELVVFVEVGAREGIGLVAGGVVVTILEPFDVTDPILWREVQTIGSPYVVVDETEIGEPTLRLWFDAFGEESASAVQFGEMVPTPPNDSIGFASAPADDPARMVVWPFNPIFDRVLTFLEHRAERSPAVVRVPGTESYFLYYVGSSTDGSEQDGLGMARTPAEPD